VFYGHSSWFVKNEGRINLFTTHAATVSGRKKVPDEETWIF
jgi:hypothetical protein